jgi:single-strand DNA-binding protein
MNSLNNSVLLGCLTHNPVKREFASGTVVAAFTLAANRHYRTEDGSQRDEVAYLPCEVWGPPANWMAEHKKGDLFWVRGRLKTETWEKNGTRHSRILLVVEEFQSLRPPERSPTKPVSEQAPNGASQGTTPF